MNRSPSDGRRCSGRSTVGLPVIFLHERFAAAEHVAASCHQLMAPPCGRGAQNIRSSRRGRRVSLTFRTAIHRRPSIEGFGLAGFLSGEVRPAIRTASAGNLARPSRHNSAKMTRHPASRPPGTMRDNRGEQAVVETTSGTTKHVDKGQTQVESAAGAGGRRGPNLGRATSAGGELSFFGGQEARESC